jgi:hypothetical protein
MEDLRAMYLVPPNVAELTSAALVVPMTMLTLTILASSTVSLVAAMFLAISSAPLPTLLIATLLLLTTTLLLLLPIPLDRLTILAFKLLALGLTAFLEGSGVMLLATLLLAHLSRPEILFFRLGKIVPPAQLGLIKAGLEVEIFLVAVVASRTQVGIDRSSRNVFPRRSEFRRGHSGAGGRLRFWLGR